MSILKTLLETEDAQNFLSEHQDLILENAEDVSQFAEILKEFVFQNPDYFLEADLDDTYKNIRIFSEFATNQYISEVVSLANKEISPVMTESRDVINEYL